MLPISKHHHTWCREDLMLWFTNNKKIHLWNIYIFFFLCDFKNIPTQTNKQTTTRLPFYCIEAASELWIPMWMCAFYMYGIVWLVLRALTQTMTQKHKTAALQELCFVCPVCQTSSHDAAAQSEMQTCWTQSDEQLPSRFSHSPNAHMLIDSKLAVCVTACLCPTIRKHMHWPMQVNLQMFMSNVTREPLRTQFICLQNDELFSMFAQEIGT